MMRLVRRQLMVLNLLRREMYSSSRFSLIAVATGSLGCLWLLRNLLKR